MTKKGYHRDSLDSIEESEEGSAPTLKPYSKETHAEGNMGFGMTSEHKGYEPTHVIHKGHGGIEGAGIEGTHHGKTK